MKKPLSLLFTFSFIGLLGLYLIFNSEEILSVKFKVLSLGQKIGWYSRDQAKSIQRNLIGDIFKNNLSKEDKDLICSLDIQLDLSLEDLPKQKWNRYTIAALGCVQPQNKKIHMALAQALKDSAWQVRREAAWILKKIKLQDKEVLAQ